MSTRRQTNAELAWALRLDRRTQEMPNSLDAEGEEISPSYGLPGTFPGKIGSPRSPRDLHPSVYMKERLNALTDQIIGAAIAVHHELGPGMLETAYEACLAFELIDRGLGVERQKALPLIYRGQILECGYRIDLLIERLVIVEVKASERFERVHSAQLRSYLRQSDCRVGLLINFNVKWLAEDGIKRVVNGFPD
jgi:GxxExxY protein